MNYKIAIPSYKRSDIIQEKTLNYLKECGIPSNIIDVFVANKEEYEIYKENVPSNLYNKLIIGQLGYNNIKNYITQYYPDKTHIIHFDDDITELQVLNKDKLNKYTGLDKLFKYGFHLLKKYNTNLLGFNGHNNPYFMSNTLNKGLYFCIGACYLTINDKNIHLQFPDFTDYELNIQSYLKNKHILRLNNISIKTNYDNLKGGTTTYRTDKLKKQIINELTTKYHDYIHHKPKKDNYYQIGFRRQKNNIKIPLKEA